MTNLEAALSYLARGWSVFPLKARAKVPWDRFPVRTFQRERRPTEQEVRGWWHSNQANVAIATGAISGVFVWDCDEESAYRRTVAKGIPNTLIARTGNGYHVFFRYPGFDVGNRAKVVAGVDIRGTGGYVVAPPSIHPSGAVYAWITHDRPAVAPEWLLALIRPKRPTATAVAHPCPPNGGDSFRRNAVAGEVNALLNAGERQRNNQLNRAAFSLGQLVGGGELSETEVVHVLHAAAASVGLEPREIMPTIMSGLNAGRQYPRTRYGRTVR